MDINIKMFDIIYRNHYSKVRTPQVTGYQISLNQLLKSYQIESKPGYIF